MAVFGMYSRYYDLLYRDKDYAGVAAFVLDLIHRLCHRSASPLTALWITHRLEELERCDGAARMEAGAIGPWQSGESLRRSLSPLPAGGAER